MKSGENFEMLYALAEALGGGAGICFITKSVLLGPQLMPDSSRTHSKSGKRVK